MRIAQIAPLAEAVPPKLYGGTERVVSWLTEELVRLGHDVTLFATGDSQTAAKLVPGCEIGLRLQQVSDHTASNLVMLDNVRRRADEFDVIHAHIDLLADGAFPGPQPQGRLDDARASRRAGLYAGLQGVPAHAADLDFRQAARADAARCELAFDRLSRPARACMPVQARRAATTSPSSAASPRRSGPIVRSRSPSAPASSSRSPPRSTMPTRNISSARSSRCSTTR